MNYSLKLNLILFHFAVTFTIIIIIVFKQVVHKATTHLMDMMLIMHTDLQMKLLLINVEKIAEEMKNVNSGLWLQTPAF
jgi:hypothetical protein